MTCSSPKGFPNIKGAILYASFVSGAGYRPASPDLADRNLFLGGMAADHHVVFFPNSAVLAGMDKWPAVFFGKGLWDRAESLEGTIAAYDRVRGLKEIVVVRGPHTPPGQFVIGAPFGPLVACESKRCWIRAAKASPSSNFLSSSLPMSDGMRNPAARNL